MNTKSNPFAIFEVSEDYVNWDKHEQQIELIEELNQDEKQRGRHTIRYLRTLLGEHFLRTAKEELNPIFGSFFVNSSAHARRSLMRLAEQLKTFEDASGFRGLVSRLKSHEKAAESLTVLGVGAMFSKVGFTVSFDPKLKNINRIPDLHVVDTESGDAIYVEVSRLRRGGLEQFNSNVFQVIFNEVHSAIWACPGSEDVTNPGVLPYVRISRSISLKELPDVINQIRRAILDTAITSEFQELIISDAVEMAVSPADDHSKAKAWADERGMRELVEALPIRLDKELRKAADKIAIELDQLPRDEPGIVAIPTTESMLFFVFNPLEIITRIAEEVRHYPNLLCAALFHSFIGSPQAPSIEALGEHALATRTVDPSIERTALVMNEGYDLPLSPSTIQKVRKAFLGM